MSHITRSRSLILAFAVLWLVGLACSLSAPTPASWALTPTAQSLAETASAQSATQLALTAGPPTVTPPPTPTLFPTAPTAPVTALLPAGPWLIYLTDQGKTLVLRNPDGSGRTAFAISPLVDVQDFHAGASPRGGYLAVRTGQANGYKDLNLDLVHLPDGKVDRLAGLLSPDLAERVKSAPGSHPDEAARALLQPGALRWSPDGRYLAFVAVIDGISSDLYLYDTQNRKVEQLTSGSDQVATPFWSPDSLWLVVQEVDSFGDGKTWQVDHIVANRMVYRQFNLLYPPPQGGAGEVFLGWTGPATLLAYSRSQAGGFALHQFDLDKLKDHPLYAGPFSEIAFDPQSKTLAILQSSPNGGKAAQEPGLYLMRTDETSPRLAQAGEWRHLSWSPKMNSFSAAGSQGVLTITPDGQYTLIKAETDCAASPNKSWVVCFAGEGTASNPGLRLYKPGSQVLQTITGEAVQEVAWQPDASGFFYLAGSRLYQVTFPGLQPAVLEENFQAGEMNYLGWVNASGH